MYMDIASIGGQLHVSFEPANEYRSFARVVTSGLVILWTRAHFDEEAPTAVIAEEEVVTVQALWYINPQTRSVDHHMSLPTLCHFAPWKVSSDNCPCGRGCNYFYFKSRGIH